MKSFYLLLITILANPLYARLQDKQTGTISGKLLDKDTELPLTAATLNLTSNKDTISIALAVTDTQGIFLLEHIPEGSYHMHISYLGYQKIILSVKLTGINRLLQLGTIHLQRSGLTLRTIEVTERTLFVIKKDTIEFNAASFNTPQHALMEELLKKLPGIQIAPDGAITINGQPVKKLLIDGLPFFSNDPKMATRNLDAKLIDKIQLIDAQGELSNFSEKGNAQTEKIINITIKKDHKKSLTGRATAGYGTDKHFALKGNVNRFGDNQQLSFLGSGNNVNDYFDNSLPAYNGGSNGITRSWQAGVNYNEEMNKQLKLSGNYTFNTKLNKQQRTSSRQNILPDTSYSYDQQTSSTADMKEHQLYMEMNYKPDTQYTSITTLRLQYNSNDNIQENSYTSLNELGKPINSGRLYNTISGDMPKLSIATSVERKFHKAGRMLGTRLSLDNNNESEEQMNRSYNTFILSGGSTTIDTIDQRSELNAVHRQGALSFYYKEPIINGHVLNFSYNFFHNKNRSDKAVYDHDTNNNLYDHLNNNLSNNFENTINTHLFGLTLEKQSLKYEYKLGIRLQESNLNNINKANYVHFNFKTVNLLLNSYLIYSPKRNKQIRIMYYSAVDQPDIMQLQPVPDNSNPVYLRTGNPNLRPVNNHNFYVEYKTLNPISFRSFNFNTMVMIINNKIVDYSWFDSLGRQISQPINVNGVYNISSTITNSFPLKKLHTFINSNTTIIYTQDISYINTTRSNIANLNINQHVAFNYTYKELLDMSVIGGFYYNHVQYSLLKNNNTDYFNYILTVDAHINLPHGISIGGHIDYWLNTGRSADYNLNGLLVHAELSKNIGKCKRGIVKLQAYDLLNRNVSISRTVGPNYIEDVQTNVLERFFMLSYTYLIKKRD